MLEQLQIIPTNLILNYQQEVNKLLQSNFNGLVQVKCNFFQAYANYIEKKIVSFFAA